MFKFFAKKKGVKILDRDPDQITAEAVNSENNLQNLTDASPEPIVDHDLDSKDQKEFGDKKLADGDHTPLVTSSLSQDLEKVSAQDELKVIENELAKEIKEQESLPTSNYFTFKVPKSLPLLLLGLFVLSLWLILLSGFFQDKSSSQPNGEISKSNAEMISERANRNASESAALRARIRDSSSSASGQAEKLAEQIRALGIEVEILKDNTTNNDQIQVITKLEKESEGKKIIDLIQASYKISSSSAQLSPDSDFDILILFDLPQELTN